MERKNSLSPEDIFLKDVKTLINNLLIDNPNFKNDYYFTKSGRDDTVRLINDTKYRAKYILERINTIEHLIKE